jgi:uncharacterized protein (DUF433 family)
MVTVLSLPQIVSDESIRGGRPVIAGTGLRVSDVAALHSLHGNTPDEIASAFDISLAQVHSALAYYFAHQAEIDAELRSDSEAFDLSKEQFRGSDSLLPG